MTTGGSTIFEFGEFRVDPAKRTLSRNRENPIPLTPKVFDTLVYLVRNRGRVIGKDELMAEIWADSVVEENNLNQNISTLRKVFGERPGEQRYIVTVPGHGYRFVPEVLELSSSAENEALIGESATEIFGVSSIGHLATGGIKRCPSCGNTYSDETLNYCLADGHALVDAVSESASSKRSGGRPRRLWSFAISLTGLLVLAAGFLYLRQSSGPSDTPVRTIAVLPFKPLVAGNRNESLELGMADALISKLSSADEIVVRPLSASRRYNSVDQDPVAAARELGVDSILDGSIQNWGDRIRISVKLLRTSDGKQLWYDQFDEKFNDIFHVQDSISQKVGAALQIQLASRRQPSSTENLEAYQLYMKGRYAVDKLTTDDVRAGIPYFEQAIAMDPQYALAYTGLAKAYGVLGIRGELSASEAFPKAKAAEEMALRLDESLGEAHMARCMGAFWYEWEWEAAEKQCKRALDLDRNNADFHGNYAALLSNLGRHDEALSEIRRSLELNPLDLGQSALEGQYLMNAGRVDDALAQLRKTAELEPRFWMPHAFAANAYIEKRMFDEAVAESDRERELSGNNAFPFRTIALALSGKRDEARSALQELGKSSKTKYVSPYDVALIHNALGEPDTALGWLEKAFEERDPKMTALKIDAKWNNLRDNPRFAALMRSMRLE